MLFKKLIELGNSRIVKTEKFLQYTSRVINYERLVVQRLTTGSFSGQLIDWHKQSGVDPSKAYMPVILLYFALRTVTALCILTISLGNTNT